MTRQPLKGLQRLTAAWRNSCAGLRDIWRSEEAFRLEILVFTFSIPMAFLISDDLFRGSILIASVLLVLLIEVLNSAIEAIIDRIGPEHHDLSRMAKDLGSLAVLLAIMISAVLWISMAIQTFIIGHLDF